MRINTNTVVQRAWAGPIAAGGSGGASSHAPQHAIAVGHDAEESRSRFAKDICEWLEEAAKSLGIARMIVFVTPQMLGVLRRTRLGETGHATTFDLHRAELTQLSPHELATQPALIGQLEPWTSTKR